MGIFQEYSKVYNRAPIELSVTFDGQRHTIPPKEHAIPRLTIPFAKNQNPIMGSQDINNPHMSGAEYLVVEEGEPGYGTPLTKEEWEQHLGRPCRMNEQQLFEEVCGYDNKARMVVGNKGKKATAANRFEAGGSPQGAAGFEADR